MRGFFPTDPRPFLAAALFLAACWASWGCNGEFIFSRDPGVLAMKTEAPDPLPYKAGVMTPRLSFAPDKLNRTGKRRYSLPPDLSGLQQEIVTALKEVGLFQEITPLSTAPQGEEKDRLFEAWDRHLDFLVEVEIEKWDTVYRGTNFWFIPNLLLWFQFWVPSWIVPDEDFATEATAVVRVTSVHTGKTVLTRRVKASYEESFSNAGRGLQILGIFRSPDSLERENWESITEAVAPGTLHSFKVGLAKELHKGLRKTVREVSFSQTMAKSLALVVGVSNYQHHKFPKAVFARKDAEAFRDFLVEEGGGGLPKRNVMFLGGEAATANAIRWGVTEFLGSRAAESDTVLVYFAGLGSVTGQNKEEGGDDHRWLLTYDTKPVNVDTTALNLKWLLDSLAALQGRVLLFLDTSFLPQGGNRSYALPNADPGIMLTPVSAPAEHLFVFSASSPGQDCGFLEQGEHGLFTYYLVHGLRGKADRNEDGRVSLDEMVNYVGKNTEIQAFVEAGREQQPRMAGTLFRDFFLNR